MEIETRRHWRMDVNDVLDNVGGEDGKKDERNRLPYLQRMYSVSGVHSKVGKWVWKYCTCVTSTVLTLALPPPAGWVPVQQGKCSGGDAPSLSFLTFTALPTDFLNDVCRYIVGIAIAIAIAIVIVITIMTTLSALLLGVPYHLTIPSSARNLASDTMLRCILHTGARPSTISKTTPSSGGLDPDIWIGAEPRTGEGESRFTSVGMHTAYNVHIQRHDYYIRYLPMEQMVHGRLNEYIRCTKYQSIPLTLTVPADMDGGRGHGTQLVSCAAARHYHDLQCNLFDRRLTDEDETD
ncbi:hypothetical protein ACRALDRAFT_208634 [Sodiomyces alcalophilus JCM 7366]|uniref:uncharacterized protein n=1 Tax=Sodiomyces alcalophilus JCM 7366 TaxID=591952 RepID=UPI0039B5C0ED